MELRSNMSEERDALLEAARRALQIEAEALETAAGRLGDSLVSAALRLARHPGKLVVTGLGKSGLIARKIAATLCSTGTPAVFLHAAEAAHGDLGVYTPGDPTLLVSKSGSTAELVRLAPLLRQMGSSLLIGILGNLDSPLARQVDLVLDARVEREADPLDLAPTASTTVALALGDALASALIQARGFRVQDFARLHPHGQLGRSLSLRVADVMHPLDRVARAGPDASLRQVVIEMTRFPLGAACILEAGRLAGLVTDGDLRRALQRHEEIRDLLVRGAMSPKPSTIGPDASLLEALRLMENRPSQISVLPVVDPEGRCLGLIRIHDIYQDVR